MTILEVKNLIKDFTKKSPSDIGDYDPRYSEYLAKCSKLLEYDKRLTILATEQKDEYFEKELKNIKNKVDKIISTPI